MDPLTGFDRYAGRSVAGSRARAQYMIQPLSNSPEDLAAAKIVELMGDSSFSPAPMLCLPEVANIIANFMRPEREAHRRELVEVRRRLKALDLPSGEQMTKQLKDIPVGAPAKLLGPVAGDVIILKQGAIAISGLTLVEFVVNGVLDRLSVRWLDSSTPVEALPFPV